VAHRLEDLLDLYDEACTVVSEPCSTCSKAALTNVKNGDGQLDVPKVARTGRYVLFAGRARVHAVDSAELGIIQALLSRLLLLLILRRC
jgi:hypothetical protein